MQEILNRSLTDEGIPPLQKKRTLSQVDVVADLDLFGRWLEDAVCERETYAQQPYDDLNHENSEAVLALQTLSVSAIGKNVAFCTENEDHFQENSPCGCKREREMKESSEEPPRKKRRTECGWITTSLVLESN